MHNGPVSTDYLRGLAEDLRDSGRSATAEDFEDCAEEIDTLRGLLYRLTNEGVSLDLYRAVNAHLVTLEA